MAEPQGLSLQRVTAPVVLVQGWGGLLGGQMGVLQLPRDGGWPEPLELEPLGAPRGRALLKPAVLAA